MCTGEDGGPTDLAGSASDRSDPLQPPGGGAFPKTGCSGPAIGEYIERIAEEMHRRVDHQRRVMRQLLSHRGNASERQAYCPLVDCERLSRLQAAVQETIDVLDETRSSFKSKRLELMRKKLIDILAGC